MEKAQIFLESIDPSLKNEDVKSMNTFGGKFLLYCIDKALKQKLKQKQKQLNEIKITSELLYKSLSLFNKLTDNGSFHIMAIELCGLDGEEYEEEINALIEEIISHRFKYS